MNADNYNQMSPDMAKQIKEAFDVHSVKAGDLDPNTELKLFTEKNRAAESGQAMAQLPKYKCHKEVWALKIAAIDRDIDKANAENRETDGSAIITPAEEHYAAFRVDQHFIRKHNPQVGGYYVVYEDGYKSFSPANAFESGYTRL